MFISKRFPPDSEIMDGLRLSMATMQKAENNLFEKYYSLISDGVRKHKLTEEECFTAYSDTVISVIDSVRKDKFEGKAELKTYIYQIFNNKCVDQIRKNATNKASVNNTIDFEELSVYLYDSSVSILSRLITENDIQKLYQSLAKIGEKCKEMILLWGEDFQDDEIAVQLGYNSSAVAKTSRLRCLQKLKEIHVAS